MKNTPLYQIPNLSFRYETPARSLRKTSNKVGFMLCATVAAIYLISFGAQLYLIGIGYRSGLPKESVAVLNYLFSGMVGLLSMAIPAVLLMLICRIHLSNTIVSHRVKPLKAISYFFIGTAVCLLANFPANWISLLFQSFGFQGSPPSIPVVHSAPAYIMSFLTTAVIPPFVEEFLCRGIILSCFRKYGDTFAVIASAFLFALIHRNFAQIVFAFICGLALGLALVKTNCIWIPTAIHMLVNSFSVSLNIIRSHFSIAVYAAVFYIFILVFVLAALFSVLYLVLKRKEIAAPIPKILSFRSSMGNLFANPGILIFTGACILLSIANLGIFPT